MGDPHDAKNHVGLVFATAPVSQCALRHENEDEIERENQLFDPQILTIGFARRFATYKRATLIFSDLDRLAEIVNDPQRPVQIMFAGKAHPKDEPGKSLIKKIAGMRLDPRFRDRVAFVEDYDVNVCRHMVQGVDVWLNNPRRPLEASGTSGQKVVLNGILNLSILDGWWAEGYSPDVGWALKGKNDDEDIKNFYATLEKEIIPLFYEKTKSQ